MLVHVNKTRKHGKVWKFFCEVKVDETLVAEAKITAMIIDSK